MSKVFPSWEGWYVSKYVFLSTSRPLSLMALIKVPSIIPWWHRRMYGSSTSTLASG
jgi:hypothetical protein